MGRAAPRNDDCEARFDEIYRAHAADVFAYALRRVPQPVAEDVFADTFLVAWRRISDVPPSALPWLLGVARHVIATHQRASARRQALDNKLAGMRAAPYPAEESDRPVISALRRLGKRDREVLLLAAWEGLSGPDAARVLGCTAVAFRLRLHRARRRLRNELDRQTVAGAKPEQPIDDQLRMMETEAL